MSAAMSSTVGSCRRDFMTETAAGPPAPVTRTRTRRSGTSRCDTVYLRSCVRMRGCGGGACPCVASIGRRGHPCPTGDAERLAVRRIADHFERLGVTAAGVAGPVACGRLDKVRLQVGPHLDLGGEGVDRFELARQVVVDVHEAGGPEVDGGRRGLETVDAAYVAHRHHGGAIGVAVVLVDVVKRMRVDRGRPYGLDDTADDADRRVAL